jgi:hypothetical protein
MAGPKSDLRLQPWYLGRFNQEGPFTFFTRHGGSKVVLSPGAHRGKACLMVRQSETDGRLVPITPEHPLAVAIALMPSMLEICLAVSQLPIAGGEDLIVDAARVVAKLTDLAADQAAEEDESADRSPALFRPAR